MHVASLSIFQLYLRHHIVNHIVEDEMYVQIKNKSQPQSLENKYEGYKLEEDELLTYKGKIYFPNVANLRRVVMDELHQAPVFWSPQISEDNCYIQKVVLLAKNEKLYGLIHFKVHEMSTGKG